MSCLALYNNILTIHELFLSTPLKHTESLQPEFTGDPAARNVLGGHTYELVNVIAKDGMYPNYERSW